MASKSERRAAREHVAAYHEAQPTVLITRVNEALDRFQAGELDAFEVDHVLFQYSRAARDARRGAGRGLQHKRRNLQRARKLRSGIAAPASR